MFFLFSKLFWFVVAPSHILIWLTIATAILLFSGRVRQARWAAGAAAILFVAIGLLPVGAWLIQGVENRYEHPAAPKRVDGILILGGGSKTDILLSRHALGMDHGLVRLVEGAVLARQYPSAKVVFSGGSGDPRHQEMPEAISARAILLSLGVPPERLTIEGKSRNTWENFVFTKEIVKPKPGDTWLLVTSGFHMPRSAGIAQKVGWKVLPWPVDFTTPARVPFSPETVPENLERTDLAVHEYIGAVIYRLTGKAS